MRGTSGGAFTAVQKAAFAMEMAQGYAHDLREGRALQLIRVEPEGAILDAGCYDGTFLASLGWKRAYGIELSPSLAAIAEKRGITVKVADLNDGIPSFGFEFDGAFAGEVVEHVLNPVAFLAALNKRIKKGGFLVLTTPNLASLRARMELAFGKRPAQMTYFHHYLFTLRDIRRALEATGFEVERVRGTYVFFSSRNVPLLQRLSIAVADKMPTLSHQLVIKARKKRDCEKAPPIGRVLH
jgi:2-polyprenyl-3-methyl-5-hydroxy-6-metoxy-1,4-benzoquinol methylase